MTTNNSKDGVKKMNNTNVKRGNDSLMRVEILLYER